MLTKEKFKASLTVFFVLLVENLLFANTIVVGVSFSIPPYVIEEKDQGVELEILREAFKIKGHTVKVKYLPLARTFMQLGSGKIDGVINIKKGMLKNVFYTDVVITFRNCAISLKKRGFPDFTDLNSLKGMYVIAFQRASYILGPEFGEMTKDNNQYEETALQKTQLFRLFMERNADFIVMEKKIFQYYRKEAHKVIGKRAELPVKFHYIFPPTEYRFAFHNKRIRDDFNSGLQTIRDYGLYSKIMKKYEKLMDLNSE